MRQISKRGDLPSCKHCKKEPATRPRGLCGRCYRDFSIRVKYPYKPSKHNPPGSGQDFNGTSRLKLPDEATETVPGSDERIRVLRERVRKKQNLWHPGDLGVRKFEE